jgi:hypothetical protein
LNFEFELSISQHCIVITVLYNASKSISIKSSIHKILHVVVYVIVLTFILGVFVPAILFSAVSKKWWKKKKILVLFIPLWLLWMHSCIQDVSLCQSIGPGLCEARYLQIIWLHLRLKFFSYISLNQLDNWHYGVDCTCYRKSILSN